MAYTLHQLKMSQRLTAMGMQHIMIPDTSNILVQSAKGLTLYKCDPQKGGVVLFEDKTCTATYLGDNYVKVIKPNQVSILSCVTGEVILINQCADACYEGYDTFTFLKNATTQDVYQVSNASSFVYPGPARQRMFSLKDTLVLRDYLLNTLVIIKMLQQSATVEHYNSVFIVPGAVLLYYTDMNYHLREGGTLNISAKLYTWGNADKQLETHECTFNRYYTEDREGSYYSMFIDQQVEAKKYKYLTLYYKEQDALKETKIEGELLYSFDAAARGWHKSYDCALFGINL